MRADRRGVGLSARRHRVPRRARRRRERRGASRVAALGAHPRRDARATRKFLLALRARAVSGAREDAAKRAAARRSRSALRAPRGGIDQETKGDRGGRPRRLRDLQAEIPVARIAARLATRGGATAISPPPLRRGGAKRRGGAPGWFSPPLLRECSTSRTQ